MILPTAQEVRLARRETGLTQRQAGKMVHSGARTWRKWETSPSKDDNRQMPAAVWDLFLIKSRRLRPAQSVFATPRY